MRAWLLSAWAVSGLVFAQARPQLDAAEAAQQRVADYLAQGAEPWQPQPLGDLAARPPDFIVASDGSGTHRTVQAAIDAAPAAGRSDRRSFILLRPGVYREIVCARDKAPITLYGQRADAATTVIVEGRYNAQVQRPGGASANPCVADPAAATIGTSGSASVAIFSDDFQLAQLTLANDAMDQVRHGQGYPPGVGESGGAQALALMTQGDRVQLERVRLLGHQDTLMVRRPPSGGAARVHVRDSLIAGDVDFVFGNATLVIEDSTLLSRSGRRAPGEVGYVLAPSTRAVDRLGFLVSASRFLAEPGLAEGAVHLGRAWDAGVPRGAWQAGVSPNGQALVQGSALGPHVGAWAASTSRRPFSATGEQRNRMAEFANRALTGRLEREVLGATDGWAAADGGTIGGALASPEHVYDVRDRAALVAALAAAGDRPKIVRLHGRIDLASDAAGKPLGIEDFRDPEFDFAAFVRAYDPAVWGRRAPQGPLEDARRRSAQRQAAMVVVRIPSNTTLLGVGTGAAVVGGMLLLDEVDNVIVRNIHFSDAYDHFPAWDPNDNAHGEWNSDYDNISLRRATHVWIDHCTLDDGDRPDSAEPVALGRRMQRHDGLLDITRASDHVTVSWNHFRRHDKTMLIGGSDGHRDDAGRLRVSLHHNLWEQVMERTPRVRYGQVHLFNNLFVAPAGAAYAYGYSIGVGLQSRIYSERNVWQTAPEVGAARLARLLKGTALFDRESLHNGRPVDLLAALRQGQPGLTLGADVGWQPLLHGHLDAAAEVAARVGDGAGAGRLHPPPGSAAR